MKRDKVTLERHEELLKRRELPLKAGSMALEYAGIDSNWD